MQYVTKHFIGFFFVVDIRFRYLYAFSNFSLNISNI